MRNNTTRLIQARNAKKQLASTTTSDALSHIINNGK